MEEENEKKNDNHEWISFDIFPELDFIFRIERKVKFKI